MSNYNFTEVERKFIARFVNDSLKLVYWGEYGKNEWYTSITCKKVTFIERRIIKMLLKLELLLPEIVNIDEYKVQRALGLVTGRIYYMPEEIKEKLKDVVIGI